MLPKQFRTLTILGLTLLLLVVAVGTAQAQAPAPTLPLTPQEQLGKSLFFDTNLSDPPGQACAACHGPAVGYTGPDQAINKGGSVYEGAVPGRFGNRKPPASAYADSPILAFEDGKWVGGMFWDGRATGERLHDPLAEQALGPFLNPAEQNNASPQVVIDKAKASSYSDLFVQLCSAATVDEEYDCIGRSIAAYERSAEVSSYTSKYDYSLKGQARLTGQERRGMELFFGKAQCGNCHSGSDFTDFTYDNLGIPKNPANPFYNMPSNLDGTNWIDYGLGEFLKSAGYVEAVYAPEMGKQKVPTLRNVALAPAKKFVKAYGHNGYFKSLEEIVHFYNTRDVAGAGWPAPEVAENINTAELGNLGLNRGEELAIVAFLATLNDGYNPSMTVRAAEAAATEPDQWNWLFVPAVLANQAQ